MKRNTLEELSELADRVKYGGVSEISATGVTELGAGVRVLINEQEEILAGAHDMREALAHIGNHGDPSSRVVAIRALSRWAKKIKPHCPCAHKAKFQRAQGGIQERCIDCGAMFNWKGEKIEA